MEDRDVDRFAVTREFVGAPLVILRHDEWNGVGCPLIAPGRQEGKKENETWPPVPRS